jgi:poly(hydroxyalkanoate) depolymerase family esterase
MPPLPAGARFDRHRHAGPAGEVDYHLFQPSLDAGPPRGLILMLHGCTQTPEDFATGTRMNTVAGAEGLMVAYPAQRRDRNPQGCWNWFRPSDQGRGGEPALLADLTLALARNRRLPTERIFVAGLSAGGAMAAILGTAYPEVFAAVGVHSGLATGAAHDVPSAFAAMRGAQGAAADPQAGLRRVIVVHGAADRTVHPANGDGVFRMAGAGRHRSERGRSGGLSWQRTVASAADGSVRAEHWLVEGLGHAWAGGAPEGSHTDPQGPDASALILRFFLQAAENPL